MENLQVGRFARLLERYGFGSASARSFRSSFDLIASRKGKLLIMKFVDNIDSLSPGESKTLKNMGSFFDADVYVLFRNRKGSKEDTDTVYTRHGVSCVPSKSLESLLEGKRMMKAQRFMKRRYKIDGYELHKMRKLYNMSMSSLADSIGVSKESIYRYEKSDSYATESSVKKLENFFKTEMTLNEDQEQDDRKNARKDMKMTDKLDISLLDLEKAPFHMLAKRHSRYEIGHQMDTRTMKKLALFYKEVSEILPEDYQLFIGKKKTKEQIGGVAAISMDELSKLTEEAELIGLIQERSK